MKLMCEISSFSELKKVLKYQQVEYVIIGSDYLSLHAISHFDFNEIEKIVGYCHINHVKVCLDVERLFHEEDVKYINMLLKNPVMAMIDYFMYSDLGFYQMMVEKGWSSRLIYNAPTYMTNSMDVSLYQKLNSFVVLSNQITSVELLEMVNNISSNYIIDTFGMGCCFYSRRPLVTNYFIFKDRKPINYMGKTAKLQEETRTNYYNLVEDENGTRVFEESHYALTKELNSLPEDSLLMIHHFNIKTTEYLKVISLYNDYSSHRINSEELEASLYSIDSTIYKGAYDNKTVLLKGEAK